MMTLRRRAAALALVPVSALPRRAAALALVPVSALCALPETASERVHASAYGRTPAMPAAQASEAGGEAARLERARLTVDLPPDGADTRVDAVYTLRLPPGTDRLPLRVLAFADARPVAVEATVDGAAARLSPGDARGRGLGYLLHLADAAAGRADRRVELRLRYGIDRPAAAGDDRFDLVVPLILPEAVPTGAPEDFFAAEVRLPRDWAIVEAFPTVPRASSPEGDGVRHAFALQVAPAMLRWRGRIGRAPILTAGRLIDLGTVAVIVVGSLLGYGWLRREATMVRASSEAEGRAAERAPEATDG